MRNFARLHKHDRERARDERREAKVARKAERRATKVFDSDLDRDRGTAAPAEAEATQ